LRSARQANSTRAYQGTGGAFDPANDGAPLSAGLADTLTANPLYARIHSAEVKAHNETAPITNRKAPLFALDEKGKPIVDPVTGRTILARPPTTQDVDMIKRANDQQVYGNTVAAKTGQPNWADAEVRNRSDASAALLRPADEANKAYAAARQSHATDTELMAAHESGTNFLNDSMQPGAVEAAVSKMKPEELEQYRLGVAQAIAGRLGNAPGANAFRGVLMTPNRQAALRAIFPDSESAARFEAMLRNETQMARTRNVVMGGSQTANKAADAATEMMDLAHAASGSPHGMMAGANRMWQRFTNNEQARAAITNDLFMKQGPKLDEALQALAALQRARANRRAGASQLGTAITAPGALQINNALD
jgi:hypothetical protein